MPAGATPSDVRFGIGLSQHLDLALAQRLDDLGFHALWVGGHLFWHTPMYDPLVQLTAYATVTRRMRLGTSVLLLPLYHPTPLAKSVATLDHVSEGRVVLGVGVGGENPVEFEACGIPLDQRGARADEGIDVLRSLWSGEARAYEGRHVRLPAAAMYPAPVQPGGPPIWVGGRSPAALARVAARGDGWIGIFRAPDRYRESVAEITAACEQAGRDPAEITFAHYLWVRVDATREDARAGARRYLQGSYGRPFDDVQVDRFCAAGDPDDLRERVSAYRDAGCRELILKPACEMAEVGEQAERLAETFL